MDKEFLVESITNTLGRTNRRFAEITHMQDGQMKALAYAEIIGELSGELANVRSELLPTAKKSRNPFKR
jgi:hypothetical protein